ncbi:MAG: ABC transporter permease [Saprospiraceae bacterium]|nr:ABC transporter permease [Saprospiraceae bacterium]
MFDYDKWQEIFASIQRHKLRTTLTALGVFWGIFMLVLLLGAGNGLRNGVEYEFQDDALNSIWIRRGVTSMEYQGLPEGRPISFDNEDYDLLIDHFDGIEHATGRFYLRGDQLLVYKDKELSFPTRGVHPGHQQVEKSIIIRGRYINQRDLDEYRKVAVIGKEVAASVFGNENPIGKELKIGGIIYTVVGEYYEEGNPNEMRIVYLPISTVQRVYAGTKTLHQLMITTGDMPLEEMKALEKEIKMAMAARHQFALADPRAIWMSNMGVQFQEYQNFFRAIRIFVWFVGIGSIIAGVIGVSNIMLIVVKDRTREIGVRKALGATPRDFIAMIFQEAIVITGLAGCGGLAAGVGVLAIISDLEVQYFRNPEINIWVGLAATLVLILAGALAGLLPARQAARIHPVVAMKAD